MCSSWRVGVSDRLWSDVIRTARYLRHEVVVRWWWRRYRDDDRGCGGDRCGSARVGLLRGSWRRRRVAAGRRHLLLWRQARGGRRRWRPVRDGRHDRDLNDEQLGMRGIKKDSIPSHKYRDTGIPRCFVRSSSVLTVNAARRYIVVFNKFAVYNTVTFNTAVFFKYRASLRESTWRGQRPLDAFLCPCVRRHVIVVVTVIIFILWNKWLSLSFRVMRNGGGSRIFYVMIDSRLRSGPALGMFEVFGRKGPPILGARQFWHPVFSVTYL